MSEVVLEMKNVTKRFPGVIALKEVSIAVEKGEVMAICGENGAGKSTLMKVLSGSYSHKEYEGEIWINGKREEFSCISDAERCGIEMVYQELNMILVASVAENLYVGNLPGNGGRSCMPIPGRFLNRLTWGILIPERRPACSTAVNSRCWPSCAP